MLVSKDETMVECDICHREEPSMDCHEIDELVYCGYCVDLWTLLEKFIIYGGTKGFWTIREDGQMTMDLNRKELADEG